MLFRFASSGKSVYAVGSRNSDSAPSASARPTATITAVWLSRPAFMRPTIAPTAVDADHG